MKTRTLRFFSVVIAAAGCAAFGTLPPVHARPKGKAPAKATAQAPPRYAAKGGYSFAVPAKWQKDDADISMERMRYALVADDTRVLSDLKISTFRDKDVSPDSIADHLRENVKEQTGTVLTVQDKTVTVSGQPGIIFETNNTRGDTPMTDMTLLTARSGITAQVILSCKTADRAKYAPVFDKVVETFKWQ